jgi:hypothetical protein
LKYSLAYVTYFNIGLTGQHMEKLLSRLSIESC